MSEWTRRRNNFPAKPMAQTPPEQSVLHQQVADDIQAKLLTHLQEAPNKKKPRLEIIAEVAGLLQIDPDFRVTTGQLYPAMPPEALMQDHIRPRVANMMDILTHKGLIAGSAEGGYDVTQAGQQEARRIRQGGAPGLGGGA